jgi:hypothetical protein
MNLPPSWGHSARIGQAAHDPILQKRRRKIVRRDQYHSPTQLVLELESQNPDRSSKLIPKGLVEALADLLLEALGVEGLTTKGGEDERQDHA